MATFNSPLNAFLHWEANTPNRVFLNQPLNGKIISYTFTQAGEEAREIAYKLKSYSLPEGSHIALFSKNCAHWIMSDLAIMMARFVSIHLYPSLNAKSINQILVHSGSKAIIIGGWIHINTHPVYMYGYLWSKVYAQDMFTVFEKNGLEDQTTGIRYRKIILANGSQRDIVEAVNEFLGRPSNNEAYIKSLGLE